MDILTTKPEAHQATATCPELPVEGKRSAVARTQRTIPAFQRSLSRTLLLLVGIFAGAAWAQANPFYVSPSGNDAHAGTEAQPFRTIERARTAARAAAPAQNRDIEVIIRGGRYELSDTLRFDATDSGRNGHRIIYRAATGEHVSISGGRRVTGWTPFRNGIFQAPSPVNLYRQLYVDGKRTVRARTPNAEFYRLNEWGGDRTIRIPAGQIDNWSNLNQVEMVIMKHWNQSRLRVGSFSKSGSTATVVPVEPERTVEWMVEWPNREPGQPYYFENSLDFLDRPGEWYLDRNSQVVYYMPRPGEDMSKVEVIAPRLERLLDIRGASNLQFIGLTFEHSTWTAPSNEGFIGIQAGSIRLQHTGALIPSAVYVESTSHLRFEGNVFRNLGGSGIDLAFGTLQTQIVGNAFGDISGCGIMVYTLLSNRNPPDAMKSRGDTIRNNFITRVGQDYTGAVAIFGSYTDGMIIENNEITDMPYSAINVGWGWSNIDTACRNNRVRYNRIHNVMNVMDDGAGIYTLSKQPGTLIEENYIYNLVRNPWAGYYEIAALYLDEQSEGITMRNNVVQNLSGVLVWKQNRANSNTVANNGNGIPNQQAIIDRSGIEAPYRDIRNRIATNAPITQGPGPFFSTPAPIPGRIEAENFDHGGPGVAYHDTTTFNQGGQYRNAEHVDVEHTSDAGGGHNVGWTEAGEWIQYTVEVARTGLYDLHFRLATTFENRAFHLKVDGQNVTGSVPVRNTGGWQRWETVTVRNIQLTAGTRVFRFHTESGPFNFNYMEAVQQVTNQSPLVAITAPPPQSAFAHGSPITFQVQASDPDGSVAKVEFFAGAGKIGESTTAPFTYVWQTPLAGTHIITARAIDNEGATTVSAPLTISVAARANTPGPFRGEPPPPFPGRIEAEHFDHGGPGVAYFDSTSVNQGGSFRTDESVDLQVCADVGGGHNVAWTRPGEWIQYTVEVKGTGTYDLRFRVASEQNNRFFHVKVDGEDATGNVIVPNTMSWQNWQTVTIPNVYLRAGVRTIRLHMDTGDINFNWFEAVAKAVNHAPTVELSGPIDQQKFPLGAAIPVSAAANDQDGSLVRVEFFAGTTKIGERTAAPFTISWTNAALGKHTLTARATDDGGTQVTSAPRVIEVVPQSAFQRSPFKGTPAPVPGRILAVEFDQGGPGVAYHDTTPANRGGAFRLDEQVDIEASVGQSFTHNIGWVEAGEWLEYSIRVAEAGRYQMSFRAASEQSSGHFSLQLNGQTLTSRINVPKTGAWQSWTNVSGPEVELPAGDHVLRVTIGAPEFNLGFIEFTRMAEQESGGSAATVFNAWQQEHFSSQELENENLTAPTADPDGDGVPNLLEYALGRNPKAPSRSDLPEIGHVEINGAKYLSLTYTRRAGTTDVQYIVEASPDMLTWLSGTHVVPVSVTPQGKLERVVIRDALPVGQSKNNFMRLRVTKASH